MPFDCTSSNTNLIYRGVSVDDIRGAVYPSWKGPTGTIANGPLTAGGLIPGKWNFGRGLRFTAANSQYINIGSLGVAGDFSIAFYIQTSNVIDWQGIFSTFNNNAALLDILPGGGFYLYPSNQFPTFNAGELNHIVWTRSGTTWTVYKNAVSQGDPVTHAVAGFAAGNKLWGRDRTYYLDGTLWEPRIYNVGLSQSDVTALYAFAGEARQTIALKLGGGRILPLKM